MSEINYLYCEANNNLDYNQMYNWTTDIPKGSRNIFVNVLELLRTKEKPMILEIGTFVGTSIIEMLKILPNAIGFAIDNWKIEKKECNYEKDIKSTFLENVKISGKNITLFEGESNKVLRYLLNNGERFDLIYVDGSHKLLDVVSDLILSWEILKSGGILAIDDYLWVYEGKMECKTAIDYFMNLYKDEYTVLHCDYRVFLYKK